jgi:N utilization substance protein A
MNGTVKRVTRDNIIVEIGNDVEAILPRDQLLPGEIYKINDRMRAILQIREIEGRGSQLMLSRTCPEMVTELFKIEVPEIGEDIIEIRGIARDAGSRSKITVKTNDGRIDPVGACVGMKGSRIHGIVRELGNENIDVINYTNNLQLFISRALSPAKVNSLKIDEETKRVEVILNPEEVSKAIGKGGSNIRLAGKLTGYEIDVFREGVEEDIELKEFSDEIEEWVIGEFKKVGLDTAKSILELDKIDLIKRTDLEEETIDEVLRILNEEFEE